MMVQGASVQEVGLDILISLHLQVYPRYSTILSVSIEPAGSGFGVLLLGICIQT